MRRGAMRAESVRPWRSVGRWVAWVAFAACVGHASAEGPDPAALAVRPAPAVDAAASGTGSDAPTGVAVDEDQASRLAALADVAAAVRRGDAEAALTALDRLPAERRALVEAALARAWALDELDRAAEAERTYDEVAASAPALVRDLVSVRRALLLARSGACERAIDLLRQGPALPGHSLAAERRLALAECLARTGRVGEALRLFEALAATRDDAPALAARAARRGAEVAAEAGRRLEARALFRALWVHRPDLPDIGDVERRLRALGDRTPLGPAERMLRASRWLAVREPSAALRELERGRPMRRDRARYGRWLHLRGEALFATRSRYAEAAAVLAEAAAAGGPTATADALEAARALLRAGRVAEAARAYDAIARRHVGRDEGHEALLRLADLERERRRPARARAALRRILDHATASAAHKREAHWALARLLSDAGRHDDARRAYLASAGASEDPMIGGRGRYWAARAAEALGRRAAALAEYGALASDHALHWYGLLARERILALGGTAASPTRPAGVVLAPLSGVVPEAAHVLHAAGLDEDAAWALTRAEADGRFDAFGARALEALARAYTRIGSLRRAYRLLLDRASRVLRGPITPESLWTWELAYPRPWDAEVRASEARHRLPADLTHAIMRQESGYDPTALSRAGARGLLQLMPATAERVARARGETVTREALFEPARNLELGTEFLAGLLARYGGCAPLAIAAYNAGGGAVDGWLPARGAVELDRFVEDIPYEQTRNYVRRVTTHLLRYRALREEPLAPLRLPRAVQRGAPTCLAAEDERAL